MNKSIGRKNFFILIMIVSFLLSSITIPQSACAEDKSGDPGNFSLDTAKEMEFDHTYGGSLQGSRYYKFTLVESSEVKVSVSKNANLDLCAFRIYDSMKIPIYEQKDVMNYNFSSNGLYLLAGQYYFEISNDAFMNDGYTQFSVIVNGASESISETQDSLNNAISTANDVALDQNYKGLLAQNDAVDYYKFVIPTSGKTSFSLQNGCASTISISIEDVFANKLGSTSISSGKADTYSMTMSAGTYYFKVAQQSVTAQGAYTFTISHTQMASKTANTTVKIKKSKITSLKNNLPRSILIKWKKVPNVYGYHMQVSTNKNFKNVPASKSFNLSPKTKSILVSNLKLKKTYYVRVRAYAYVSGSISAKYGSWSAKKKIKIKK